MASCEICGSETDSPERVKIEGAKMKVCGSCSEMGRSLEATGSSVSSSSGSGGGSRIQEKVLVPNYGSRVKEARESEDLTQNELSDRVSEKESRVSKIEKGELKPDESLANRLSRELGIELYTTPEVSNHSTGGTDSRSATLGDVADMK